MAARETCSIAVRSYGPDSTVDRHDFSQIVLPLAGELSMDIAGREARLDRTVAAFVEAGARHDQVSRVANRSLIVDVTGSDLDARTLERLARRPYLPLLPEAASLIEYMSMALSRGHVPAHRLGLWIPLLADALLGDEPRPRSRLSGLLAAMEADPAWGWTVEAMAARIGVSASRLHALFQEELGTTPRAWLSGLRLARVRHLLAHTDLPIAELAYRAGYADQSALTRAMRKATGLTPATFRRNARDAV